MEAQAGNVQAINNAKYADIPFKIIEFHKAFLWQVSPFKNTGDQHFAILFYVDKNKDCPNSTANVDDRPGHLLFKSPGQSDVIISQRNIVSGFCVQFTEKFLLNNKPLLSIITGFPFFEISLLKNKPLLINTVESEMIGSLYRKVYEEYNYKHTNENFEIIHAYLQALLLTIKRIYESYSGIIEQEKTSSKRQTGAIVQMFKSLVCLDTVRIADKGMNRKTVSAYASMLFIHPNYLNALVKKETGKTAREYIDGQLFNCAKRLLLNEQLLVKEIAWQLSFNETAHFNNFFKRHAGVSPGIFRKQYFMAAA